MDLVPREYKRQGGIVPPAAPGSSVNFAPNTGRSSGLSLKIDYLKIGIIAAALLLILALAVWGGLKIYGASLNSKIDGYKKQEAAVFAPSDLALAEKIADLNKRATATEDFFKDHIYSSVILNSIASLTLPKVKWNEYDLSVKDSAVTLKGVAADYSFLAKQLFVFEDEASGFSKVVVSGVTLDKSGVVNFTVSFNFDPKVLKK